MASPSFGKTSTTTNSDTKNSKKLQKISTDKDYNDLNDGRIHQIKINNLINTARIKGYHTPKPDGKGDRGWQSLAVSRCLWGCDDSPKFSSN